MHIENHILTEAVQAPSPNYSSIIVPKFIVVHYTAGWTVAGVLSTFAQKSSKVSAHLTIDTDGTVYQHVPFNRKAWHAGPSEYKGFTRMNSHSIGIELVNPGYLRKVSGSLSNRYMDSNGETHELDTQEVIALAYPRVGSGVFYWPIYTPKQLQVLEDVTKFLITEYALKDIASHEEIDTRGWKTDPGPAFPMDRFKRLFHDNKEDEQMLPKPPLTMRERFMRWLSEFT